MQATPNTGRYIPGSDFEDDFTGDKLHVSWNYIYNPVENLITFGNKGLCLHGNAASISCDDYKSILVRRQEHFDFESTMHLEFSPEEGEEAGLTIYMSNLHHYEIALTKLDGEQCLIIRRQIGKLKAIEEKVPYAGSEVVLKLIGKREEYNFAYSANGTDFTILGGGESQYLSTEAGGCFTGNMIGLYASGNGKEAKNDARVTKFTYKAIK